MAEMKVRPIIFSADMVQAILSGRKTQTRRVVKPQPQLRPIFAKTTTGFHQHGNDTACPYCVPGDRLWVRETLMVEQGNDLGGGNFSYLADRECVAKEERKIPAIHMPRWASRITLAVVKVRVERLVSITFNDAWAEGFGVSNSRWIWNRESERDKFRKKWDELNAKRGYPWSSNPWVWVIEFKILHKEG